MQVKITQFLIGFAIIIVLAQCNTQPIKLTETQKFQSTDLFKTSMTASEYFSINGKADTVIEGNNGTILVCPAGCFKNSKGEIIKDNVKIELVEALSLDEMILSNLTTTSNGEQLETDGMIYFNATSNGEILTINKNNPIHIEIPTKRKKQGMMVYKGLRDKKGNMNWVNPLPLQNYLIPVNLDLLDFLPDGFSAEVEKGMPYKKYTTASKQLTDSLYYSLAVSNGSELTKDLVNTNLNEPYYNKHKQIINGKYSKESYETTVPVADSVNDYSSQEGCGINPASIKVLTSKKYQNTLIATKEFEARLKVIFKTCNNAVLKIYANNIGKNLYRLDSMASIAVKGTQYEQDFHHFYLQKCTNVKNADKYAQLLRGYYNKQLLKTTTELEAAKEKLVAQLNRKNVAAEKVAANYRNLLWKREKYRMETYGFNWTETGWINIDTGTIPKTWGPQRLEITIQNPKQYDRMYTYVVYTTIKSLYRLNSDNDSLFYVGNNEDKKMLMPKHSIATAIAIGYKGENSFLAIKQFETGTDEQLILSPQVANKETIKQAIKAYDKYAKENKISVDLEYMDKFFIEQTRQKVLLKEGEFINRLWQVAHPCCTPPVTLAEK